MPRALALSALFVVAAACGSASIDRSSLTTSVCASGAWSPLRGVTATAPTTYVALVELLDGQRLLVDETGTQCATAPDVTACRTAITDARPATGWTTQQCGGAGCHVRTKFFVAEHAGVVTVVDRLDALQGLVAPLDGAADAVLLASFARDASVDCSTPQARPLEGGGWEVLVTRGDGQCTDRTEYLVDVALDGTVTTAQSTFTKAKQECIAP